MTWGRETVPRTKISLFWKIKNKEKTMKRWSAVVRGCHTTVRLEVEAADREKAKEKAKQKVYEILEELHLACPVPMTIEVESANVQ